MFGLLVDPLRAAVDATLVTDPSDLGDVGLSEEIISLRAQIDRLEAQFAKLVYAGHQRGIGRVDGSPSTAAWLRRHTGMREGDARAAITRVKCVRCSPPRQRHGATAGSPRAQLGPSSAHGSRATTPSSAPSSRYSFAWREMV